MVIGYNIQLNVKKLGLENLKLVLELFYFLCNILLFIIQKFSNTTERVLKH